MEDAVPAVAPHDPVISMPFLGKEIAQLRVTDVIGHERPVYSVKVSDTVGDVVKFLARHKISSAPIVDASDLLVGLIDYSDILHHLVSFGLKEESSGAAPSLTRSW
jgi:CBS domain-containing protein